MLCLASWCNLLLGVILGVVERAHASSSKQLLSLLPLRLLLLLCHSLSLKNLVNRHLLQRLTPLQLWVLPEPGGGESGEWEVGEWEGESSMSMDHAQTAWNSLSPHRVPHSLRGRGRCLEGCPQTACPRGFSPQCVAAAGWLQAEGDIQYTQTSTRGHRTHQTGPQDSPNWSTLRRNPMRVLPSLSTTRSRSAQYR